MKENSEHIGKWLNYLNESKIESINNLIDDYLNDENTIEDLNKFAFNNNLMSFKVYSKQLKINSL